MIPPNCCKQPEALILTYTEENIMDIVPRKRRQVVDRQTFAYEMHKKLRDANEHRCAVCGWTPPPALNLVHAYRRNPSIIEIHHILPISAGGLHTEENVIALCPNHHRVADLLASATSIGDSRSSGITDRETLLRFLSLLDNDPDAFEKEILEWRARAQSDITRMLSDLLSDLE
jgi:hypothetical protein